MKEPLGLIETRTFMDKVAFWMGTIPMAVVLVVFSPVFLLFWLIDKIL